MFLRSRSVLIAVVAALAVLSGCSSTNSATPPPTGGFSDTDLNGTYVFSTSGVDVNGFFLTMVGTFDACGCSGGTISSGVVDLNDPNFTAPVTQLAITGGTYSVGVDGRGKASLSAATPFGNTIVLDFVLSSNQGGLVTEFDGNGTGSGTLDLQGTPAQTAGTYVFNLAGIAAEGLSGGIPLGTVGSVTLDGSGNATGVQDYNNNGTYSGLTISLPSTVLVGTGPTSATLITNGGNFDFDVYAISSTHFKWIETDAQPILEGDVYAQSTATFPTGPLAFSMVGLDYQVAGGPFPLVVGGMMNSTGTTFSGGVEDFNDGGTSNIVLPSTTAPITFSGGISAGGTGRYLVTLGSGFFNGDNGDTTVNFTFAAYPSSGGTQMLEIDGIGITGGAAYPQTVTSFASGQGYGLNLTASSEVGEQDDIAEFTNTSNNLSGLVDVNNQGSPNTENFSGAYTADTTNLGRGILTSGDFNLTSYTLDGTNTIFIEIDPTQVGLGSIGQQAAQSQGAIATRLAVMHPRVMPRGDWKTRAAAAKQSK